MKRELSRFGEGESLQVVHEVGEEASLIQCVVDVFGRGLIDAIHDAFEVALNDVERRAEFVRDVGGEVAALLRGAFEFADHLVEAFDEIAEHIGFILRHARREIALFDGIDRFEKLFERFAVAKIEVEGGNEKDDDQNDGRATDEDPNVSDVGVLRKEQVKKSGDAPDKKENGEDEEDDEEDEAVSAFGRRGGGHEESGKRKVASGKWKVSEQ